eukprot:485563_1
MSLSSIFVKVEFELKFRYHIPKPSYHPQNQNVVIVSTSCGEAYKKGIYEYNLKQNTFNKIHTYKQTFKPVRHGQFIDSKNELLYIFGNHTFGIFDLNTRVMN